MEKSPNWMTCDELEQWFKENDVNVAETSIEECLERINEVQV